MKKFLSLFPAAIIFTLMAPYAFADYAYHVPYYTSQGDNNTGIGIRNCSMAQSARVTIIVYNRDGDQQLLQKVTVPARGQTAFTVGRDLDVDGSMRITSDQPLTGLALTFMEGNAYGADIAFTQQLSATLYNPHVASSSKWNTTIVVNNPQNSATSVNLTYVDQNGTATLLTTSAIPANGIGSYLLSDLLGGGSFSGSVEVTANQEVAGLVLYSNRGLGGSYYSGIAAIDPADQVENYTPTQFAVVATISPDYASSALSLIPVDEPRIAQNNLLRTLTGDITVAAYGQYFYRIERFLADTVTKFDINDPDTVIWQFSTLGDEPVSSNPYDMIFASDTKAYILRYETNKAWIVNPSATTSAEFKIGELDLSPYADPDGIPEMGAGVIAENKLFIVLQRIDRDPLGWVPTNTSYVAVFDTVTDTEIDTNADDSSMMGIPLDIKNPQAIQYQGDNNTLYVQGAGKLEDPWSGLPAEYSGGIVTIDPTTYETTLLVDDGDAESHPYGNISGMVVASATKGYFIGYVGWGDNTVYSFNPTTGAVTGEAADYLSGKNIAGLESGVYADNNGVVWICNQTDSEVVLLNSADDTVLETISTYLSPSKVVFCEP